MSYEQAMNPQMTRVLPGTLAQYKVPDKERLGDYESVTGTSGFGDYTTTNLTQRNPFRRYGYNPLLAKMQGYGEVAPSPPPPPPPPPPASGLTPTEFFAAGCMVAVIGFALMHK